jgi:beta-glucosidase
MMQDATDRPPYRPTFGLIAVDRETFVRTPKPSLAWLGEVARRNAV